MGRSLIKIKDQYLVWSSTVDAPITYGMTKEEAKKFFINEAIKRAAEQFEEDFSTVEERGITSRIYKDLDSFVKNNRAGENESKITLEEIYQRYCVERTC